MRRKLTAIVAADIVGYSRRLSEDESGTLAAIEALRVEIIEPHLARHSGRIFRLLGDSTLLEFDSALGAVEFATEVQQCLASRNAVEPEGRALVLRMGLDLGDVVIDGDEIHGEGINIAVRLEEMADPGGICLSDKIHAQIKKQIDPAFVPIGSRTLKNISEPVQVWRWRPGRIRNLPPETAGASSDPQNAIHPHVTELILRLHARSAQLAISNALDDALDGDEEEQRRKADNLYARINEELLRARSMLQRLYVEPTEQFREISATAPARQSLIAFMSRIFQDRGNAYLLSMLPEAQIIMTSNDTAITKRRRFLDLVRRFHDEEFVVRSHGLIKTAFVE